MKALIVLFIRWAGRHFISFLVIVAILAAANAVQKEFAEFKSVTTELAAFKNSAGELARYITAKESETTTRVERLEQDATNALKNRLDELDKELLQKISRQPSAISRSLSMLKSGSVVEGFVDGLKLDIEIKLLEQERAYLRHLHAVVVGRVQRLSGYAELERRRQVHAAVYDELKKNEVEQAVQKAESYYRAIFNPWSPEYKRLQELKRTHAELIDKNLGAYQIYTAQLKFVEAFKIPNGPTRFELQRDQIEGALQPLHERIAALERRYEQNWLAKFSEPVINVLPTALAIMLAIILLPIAIKAVFYFFIAPMASRRAAICLLPDVSGVIESDVADLAGGSERAKVSAVSIAITVNAFDELLIHPEYLQSSSLHAEKVTKWLLDWSYPMSSLASGMFALTRIRATESESIVVSATRDPFSEVGVITIPEGAALVLQPHCLVGVVQRREFPVRISRHWRLGSLHAWLTLQLRYLVFHGPAKLIVRGSRGVRVETAGNGQSINQAATIGFSANLAYSTTRCETFASYLMGQQELFNDNFAGTSGCYVYEETPHFGKRTGITGRGIEGVTDSFLKMFGI